jgi:hypothetical protein
MMLSFGLALITAEDNIAAPIAALAQYHPETFLTYHQFENYYRGNTGQYKLNRSG